MSQNILNPTGQKRDCQNLKDITKTMKLKSIKNYELWSNEITGSLMIQNLPHLLTVNWPLITANAGGHRKKIERLRMSMRMDVMMTNTK